MDLPPRTRVSMMMVCAAFNCFSSVFVTSICQPMNKRFSLLINKGPLKYDLDNFLVGLEPRGSYYGPHSEMPGEYNFRWKDFGDQQPIDVPRLQHPGKPLVKKGHLVFHDFGTKKFSFMRLPSPLLENSLGPCDIEVSHTVNCGWDFCPLLGLLVVGTNNGDGCVCLEVPAIQSSLTFRTRTFTVRFRDMDTGKQYPNRPKLQSPVLDDIIEVELQLTSRRLAAKVRTGGPSPCRVFLWNLEGGNLYPVGVSCFIPLPKTRWSHESVEGDRL